HRRMVRAQGVAAARASAGGAWKLAAGTIAIADRADRRRQDAGRLSANAERPGRGRVRGTAHALRLAAQGAGGGRAAQPQRADLRDGAEDFGRNADGGYAGLQAGAATDQAA